MWQGNPALTSVLFGLPLGFFALICYSICCADIMDADEEEEEMEPGKIILFKRYVRRQYRVGTGWSVVYAGK
jgi:hypothetical protein